MAHFPCTPVVILARLGPCKSCISLHKLWTNLAKGILLLHCLIDGDDDKCGGGVGDGATLDEDDAYIVLLSKK